MGRQHRAVRDAIDRLATHTDELDRVRDRLAQAQQVVVSELGNIRDFAKQLAPSPAHQERFAPNRAQSWPSRRADGVETVDDEQASRFRTPVARRDSRRDGF
jgi:hypothetical protein